MTEYVLARLEAIQQELNNLRNVIAHQTAGPGRKTKLKGLWKGVQVTEEDLEEAERAVFKDAYRLDK